MAATEGSAVLALISKRLRALRKKQNRISEMEDSISQGKTLNKDQEEILRSKPIITALIEELVKLRLPPPSAAVVEEISLHAKKKQQQKARKEKAEEENVTAKTNMEDCKISDSLNSGEVSKDNTSPCSGGSSQSVTPSPSSRKSRRRRKSKKPQTSE